jgi:hypothetical protein
MEHRAERNVRRSKDPASEAETWPWALHDILQAVATHATGQDRGRCASCHNLTGGLDLRIVGNGLVACSRCARHAGAAQARTGS